MDKRNCLFLLLPNFISIDKSKYRHQLFLKYLKLVSIGCYPTLFSGPGPFNCEMPKLSSLWKAVCDIIHKSGKSCMWHHRDTRTYYSDSPTMVVGFDSGTKHIDPSTGCYGGFWSLSHFFGTTYFYTVKLTVPRKKWPDLKWNKTKVTCADLLKFYCD